MRMWRRRILFSTWMAYAGLYFCRKPFYLAKKTLATDLDLTVAELGEAGLAYLICYTIGQYLTAGLGHRFGARKNPAHRHRCLHWLQCGLWICQQLLDLALLHVPERFRPGLRMAHGGGTIGNWTKRTNGER